MSDAWYTLPKYNNYEVNTNGLIRNRQTQRLLTPSVNQTNTRYVNIRNTISGQYETKAVSVLFAEAFHGEPVGTLDTVLHLNGDRFDCRPENIMWADRHHVINFHKELKFTQYQYTRYIQDGETSEVYTSIADAATKTGCVPSHIDYALTYNDTIGKESHANFVQRCAPSGRIFRSL